MVTDTAQPIEELAHREADGIAVSLLWRRAGHGLSVVGTDTRTEERFTVAAKPSNALNVFHHPFAYAAQQHIECRLPVPRRAEALV